MVKLTTMEKKKPNTFLILSIIAFVLIAIIYIGAVSTATLLGVKTLFSIIILVLETIIAVGIMMSFKKVN